MPENKIFILFGPIRHTYTNILILFLIFDPIKKMKLEIRIQGFFTALKTNFGEAKHLIYLQILSNHGRCKISALCDKFGVGAKNSSPPFPNPQTEF